MIVASLLVAVLLGFLIVRSVWPGAAERWESADWLRLPAGALIGLGLSSITGFLFQVVNPQNRGLWVLGDIVVLVLAMGCYLALGRRGVGSEPAAEAPVWAPAKWVAIGAVVTMVVAYLLMALPRQTGEVDAWSIWNMRARFLFRGGTFATLADPLLKWIHPEFPYLVSGLVLRTWRWAGQESFSGAMGVAGLFVASASMLMYGGMRIARTHSQGLLALVALLGSAGFIGNGVVQYADFPLAAYLLGSLLLVMAAERLALPRIALLAGLCAGFAAWTKFEGLFYAIALMGIATWRLRAAGLIPFVAGAVPGLAMLAYFKMAIAPVTQAPSADPIALLMAIASKLFTFSFLGWLVPPFAVFALYLYCVGVSKERRQGWISLAALFVAGALAVIVRDDNVGDAAAIRLLLHLWMIFLAAIFMHANAPEELMAPPPSKSAKPSRK